MASEGNIKGFGQLEPVKDEYGLLKQIILYIGGSEDSFRCKCGCNVFHHPDKTRLDIYECNGCQNWYTSKER